MSKYDYGNIFNYIVTYKSLNDGNSPTLRTLMEECDISSTSVARYILQKLEEEGKITLNYNTGQFINVVGGKWSYG